MNQLMQFVHKKSRRWWHRVALATLLLCFALMTVFSFAALTAYRAEAARTLAFSAQDANQRLGLDPNRLEDPVSYDTRPCVQHPSDATCSGKYPVSPPHISPRLGVMNGAGSCIYKHSIIPENQVITDTRGHAVGNLQIFWLPTCQAYYGTVSFSFPLSQVTQASIWIQTESDSNFVQWFQAFTGLAPAVHHFQATGPVAGADLNEQGLTSPLIWAPAAPTSVYIDIQLVDGSEYGNATASYAAGFKRYNGVP
jgi:hypothetical protein